MVERVPYKKLASYPHMKPADAVLWERFIEKYPDAYEWCIYDLNVGEGFPPPEQHPSATEIGYHLLTQKKIDVVAGKGADVDVIELKPDAHPAAFGQVLSYVHLYQRDVDPTGDATPVIITDRLNLDMEHLAAKFGVVMMII